MLIDTHAHVNFVAFREDSEKIIKKTLEEGVQMINVGSQIDTSRRAVSLAEKFGDGVYAAIGLHPIHLETTTFKAKLDKEEIDFKTQEEKFDYEEYKKLAGSKKVVAVGEIGLDYYWKPKTKIKLEDFKERQKQVFFSQLALAEEMNLPVILHCRMAHDDLIEILRNYPAIRDQKLSGVIHCFTGTLEQAKKYVEMGFYLGFNGIIFKFLSPVFSGEKEAVLDFNEVIKNVPLDKILVETDCPYLTPPPFEGQRNEPIYVKYVAERIAEIRKKSFEEIAAITTENAKKLFRI